MSDAKIKSSPLPIKSMTCLGTSGLLSPFNVHVSVVQSCHLAGRARRSAAATALGVGWVKSKKILQQPR